jgi:sugar phosphate isomerase/epimerase
MYIACSTLPFREKALPEALRKIAHLGIKQVEFCSDPLHSLPEQWKESPEEILRLVNRLGTKVNSIHVPVTECPPNIPYDELRRISTQQTKNTIDLASFFGASFVVQHVRLLKNSLDLQQHAILEEITPNLEEAARYAATKGVKLALENVPTSFVRMLGANAKELMNVVNLLPPETIGICLDVTHCVASGYDPLGALNEINIHCLISIHASDNFSNQLIDQHLPIGSGDIPWEKLFDTLESLKFQGSVVIEVAGGEEEGKTLKDSLNYLQNFDRFLPDLGTLSI